MKNKKYEIFRLLRRTVNTKGLSKKKPTCHHVLDPNAKLGWWHDIAFKLNDYRVSVAWCHPRHHYADAIKEVAEQHVRFTRPDLIEKRAETRDFLKGLQEHPIYKPVGKSRKKIRFYEWHSNDAVRDYYDAVFEQRDIFFKTGIDFEVRPSVRVEWFKGSRFVEICAPLRCETEEELQELMNIVSDILKQKTTLDVYFPNYVYTKESWISEASDREEERTRNV